MKLIRLMRLIRPLTLLNISSKEKAVKIINTGTVNKTYRAVKTLATVLWANKGIPIQNIKNNPCLKLLLNILNIPNIPNIKTGGVNKTQNQLIIFLKFPKNGLRGCFKTSLREKT